MKINVTIPTSGDGFWSSKKKNGETDQIRIGWLVSGYDTEQSFLQRLEEDLSKL